MHSHNVRDKDVCLLSRDYLYVHLKALLLDSNNMNAYE